jgi:hypothetical protein
MVASKRFQLNTADIKSQLKSALIFLAPSILAFLAVLTPAVNAIVPETTEKLLFLVILKWALDQGTGLLRKYLDGKVGKA